MKDDIAERLLAVLMDWDVEELKTRAPRLQALASIKYDEYGQYRPGVKFAENLGAWLRQFDAGDERDTALRFVENDLLFITDRELAHLIELAYPDFVEKAVRDEVAGKLSCPRWHVKRIRESADFKIALRRNLFLGLSDGARLDRFRRAAPLLSHEQFTQEYEIAARLVKRMTAKLRDALSEMSADAKPVFERIWLIDDFAGSGRTLIRPDAGADIGTDVEPGIGAASAFKGKLAKFKDRLKELLDDDCVSSDAPVHVLLYVATSQAISHVEHTLAVADLGTWRLHVIHEIPSASRVEDTSAFASLCCRYYDPSTIDEHKQDAPLGYSDCALPLVLSHNTPNNSVCLLWSETGPEVPARNRRALFPRYERHHKDRP